ncbi:MAG: hypothetical protein IK083_00855 [Abditibacteriota bacterium]|nr:hypothetical protein [Abditibacteriota bacterium]
MKTNKTSFVLVLLLICAACGAFCQEVLYEPYPRSTSLDAAHREPVFTLQSRVATLCRYSVNELKDYGEMTPFDETEPTNMHTVRLRGLDARPGAVNRVYVKCDASGETLELTYTFVTERDPSLSGAAVTGLRQEGGVISDEELSRLSLISSADLSRDRLAALKETHRGLVCLLETFISSAPAGLKDSCYLRDREGALIEAFPGRYRLDLTSFETGSYITGRIYEQFAEASFLYDGCLLMDLVMTCDEIYRDWDPRKKHQPKASDKETEEAWYKGVVYALRNLRWYYPYGIVTAHTTARAEDTTLFKLLNGKGIVYTSRDLDPDICRELLSEYEEWMARVLTNKVVLIEYLAADSPEARSAADGPGRLPGKMWREYSRFRFGYALSRMNDGIFTARQSEFVSGSPWFDEYAFDLGRPVSKAKYYSGGEEVYTKTNVINAINSVTSRVFRRDFEKGIILLNGESEPVRILLEEDCARFVSGDAPLWEKYFDNSDPAVFSVAGSDFKKADAAAGRELYIRNGDCVVCSRSAAAGYSFGVPFEDDYSLEGYFPGIYEGPEPAERIYCDLYVNGRQADAAEIETASLGPGAVSLFDKVSLKPGDEVEVRITGDGFFAVDFIYLSSGKRYNDGSPAKEITLDPYDGILLKRAE